CISIPALIGILVFGIINCQKPLASEIEAAAKPSSSWSSGFIPILNEAKEVNVCKTLSSPGAHDLCQPDSEVLVGIQVERSFLILSGQDIERSQYSSIAAIGRNLWKWGRQTINGQVTVHDMRSASSGVGDNILDIARRACNDNASGIEFDSPNDELGSECGNESSFHCIGLSVYSPQGTNTDNDADHSCDE
ncbi:MAG: hypothetical protein ABSE85_20190, partial [Candidatus Korobacteraceae bacterium]